jgi:hypothetical protein
MPIIKTSKGFKFGKSGKLFPTRMQAVRQGQAIKASQGKKK